MTVRVLQILPSLNTGGVEKTTIDVMSGLVPFLGSENIFVASKGGVLQSTLEDLGVKHITLPLTTKNPINIIKNAFRLRDVILKRKITVLHARSRAPAWSALLASKMTGVPMITTYHGAHSAGNILKRLYNSSMVRGKVVIAMSDYMASYIKKNHPNQSDKIRLIPKGIRLDSFDPRKISHDDIKRQRAEWDVEPDNVVVLLPGRKSGWKGNKIFAEAIAKIKDPKVIGVILGGSAELKNPRIRAAPWTESMPLVYKSADIVVSASTKPEAFGRVMGEAAAMECVRVGTNIGATPELCSHGETGILVKPGDADALAEGIIKAVSLSDSEKESMRQKSRQLIENYFDYAAMIQAKLKLYREL